MATDVTKLVDQLGKMTVLELVELKNALEEQWGVTAAAPVAVAAAPGAPAAGGDGAAAADEEQTAFDVVLTAAGDKKIQVIKVVRAITGPGPDKGKPPGKGNGKNGAPAVSSTSLSTSTSTTGSTTTTTTPSGKKVQLCHRTHSKKKPWVLITVSRNALKAHLKHGDVLPVNGQCPSSQGTTTTST